MECERCREALSARVDGEDPGVPDEAVDHHVAACVACGDWREALAGTSRRVRLAPAEPVPDLTTAILAEAAVGRRSRRTPWSAALVARLVLAAVALGQVVAAVPGLLGDGHGATVHVAREQGSWELALAVGLLAVAWRPQRAAGLLPVAAALGLTLLVATGLDAAAGHTSLVAERSHALPLVGLLLLVVVHRLSPARALGRSAALGT